MPKMNGGSNSKDHHTNVINLLNDEYKANTTTVTRVKSSKKRYVNTNASEKLKLSLSKCKKELQLINQSINDYEKKIRPLKLRREQLMNQINTCNNKLKLLPTSVPGEFSKEFSWDIEIQEALKNIFNITSFRLHQKEAINAVLSKKDVFVVKPTGGGKSLIFQAPAVIEEGFTLVISPLVSLSHDQSLHLRDLGINAKVLDASTTKEEVKNIYNEMIIDRKSRDIDYNLEMMKILYVTPEKIISSKRFFQKLQQAAKLKNLTRIVIDEAHCVSGWGCDFRPAYRQLDLLRTSKDVDQVPILALTATATRNVQNDVQNILKMKHTELFLGSFNRLNLFYSVQEKPTNNDEFVSAVVNEINICKRKFNHNIDPCGIIYVHSRGDADKLSKILNDKHSLTTLPYHAGLEHHDKKRTHESWRNDVTKIIVATVAFGMGIDKSNVRFVIHSTLSKSMETYLQESGRAGRDGKLSRCTMFYRREDISKVSSLIHDSNNKDVATHNLYKFVKHFCEYDGKTCRRKSVAVILGEVDPENIKCNNLCDICCSEYKPREYDATNAVVQIIKLLKLVKQNNVRENVSMIQLLELWCGNGKIWKELKHFVNDSELEKLKARKKEVNDDKNNLMKIIVNMLLKGFLKEIFIANVYSWNVYVDVTDLGNIFMVQQESIKNSSQHTFGKLDYDNCNSAFKIILDQDKKKSTSLSKRKRKGYDVGNGTGSVDSSSSKQNGFHNIDGTNISARKTIRKKNTKSGGGNVSNTAVINLIDDDDDDDFRDFVM